MSTEIIPGLKQLWKTVFGDPNAFIDAFFQTAYSPDRCRYDTRDGQIICALYWFDCSQDGRKFAYIYAVATDPAYRGQGLASRLLLETHQILKQQGYSGTVLKPANGLFPFYERLGYQTSCYVNSFTAEAGTSPARIHPLSPGEYAARRRELLPENAILQEGVTLDFLSVFAGFYAVDGGVFCVSREESEIIEYLADPNLIPAVLAALSLKTTKITTPGGDLPFVMYHPLDNNPAPGYLGLSLE